MAVIPRDVLPLITAVVHIIRTNHCTTQSVYIIRNLTQLNGVNAIFQRAPHCVTYRCATLGMRSWCLVHAVTGSAASSYQTACCFCCCSVASLVRLRLYPWQPPPRQPRPVRQQIRGSSVVSQVASPTEAPCRSLFALPPRRVCMSGVVCTAAGRTAVLRGPSRRVTCVTPTAWLSNLALATSATASCVLACLATTWSIPVCRGSLVCYCGEVVPRWGS